MLEQLLSSASIGEPPANYRWRGLVSVPAGAALPKDVEIAGEGNQIYRYGGRYYDRGDQVMNRFDVYNRTTGAWSGQSTTTASKDRPPPLYKHAMLARGRELMMFAGITDNGLSSKTWFFNRSTTAWTSISNPSGLTGATRACWLDDDKSRCIVVSGRYSAIFTPLNRVWVKLPDIPIAVERPGLVRTSEGVFLFGGLIGTSWTSRCFKLVDDSRWVEQPNIPEAIGYATTANTLNGPFSYASTPNQSRRFRKHSSDMLTLTVVPDAEVVPKMHTPNGCEIDGKLYLVPGEIAGREFFVWENY